MANGTWKIARRGNAQLPLIIVLALGVMENHFGRQPPRRYLPDS